MATKPVNPDDPGQAQIFLTDLLLLRRGLSDFQVMVLMEAMQYEWQYGHAPQGEIVWRRLARPKNKREKSEITELIKLYERVPLVQKLRLQKAENIRRAQDWKFIRLQVLERDAYQCGYCGKPAGTVDHIQPRAQGGLHAMDNLVAACHSCNCRKNARTPEQAGMMIIYFGGKEL